MLKAGATAPCKLKKLHLTSCFVVSMRASDNLSQFETGYYLSSTMAYKTASVDEDWEGIVFHYCRKQTLLFPGLPLIGRRISC